MVEFSELEFDALYKRVLDCIADVSGLAAWIDSLEFELKNYVGDYQEQIFLAFVQSLVLNLNGVRTICKSKSGFLDL